MSGARFNLCDASATPVAVRQQLTQPRCAPLYMFYVSAPYSSEVPVDSHRASTTVDGSVPQPLVCRAGGVVALKDVRSARAGTVCAPSAKREGGFGVAQMYTHASLPPTLPRILPRLFHRLH